MDQAPVLDGLCFALLPFCKDCRAAPKANVGGCVSGEAQPAAEFITQEGPLFDQPLTEPRFKRIGEPLEHAEHVVGIDWRKTVETNQAKRFKGAFANQNIVCKLRDEATVDFLLAEFGVDKRV